MNFDRALLALLVFPGLLYAAPMGWLMLGVERRLAARFGARLGPPLTQPFWDFVKLLAKRPVPRAAADKTLLALLPLLALGSMLGALALLPVFADGAGFAGDLILLVGLLEMPPLLLVLAGYASRSIYGEVGATREAVLSLAGGVPFLAALIALAAASGSLSLAQIAAAAPWAVRVPALIALLLCLPVKLRVNPFSVANAEQEILAGPLTEYDGPRLALWELTHGLERVALAGFAAILAVPLRDAHWALAALVFAALSLVVVALLATFGAAMARFKLRRAARFLWRWASLAAAAALLAAAALRYWRA